MKLYTFLDETGNIITQVRAENHDKAVILANGWSEKGITTDTDFYSDTVA